MPYSLNRGERLLWSGAPRQGILLRPSDALFIPFSLLWGGFAIFWELSVIRDGAPFFFALWGIPFVVVGLFLIVGRFYWDSWRRAHTAYAVTSERLIISVDGLGGTVRSLGLDTLPLIELEQRPDGDGSLVFGTSGPYPSWMTRGGWPGAPQAPMFERIANAKSVYDLINEARRTMRSGVA